MKQRKNSKSRKFARKINLLKQVIYHMCMLCIVQVEFAIYRGTICILLSLHYRQNINFDDNIEKFSNINFRLQIYMKCHAFVMLG